VSTIFCIHFSLKPTGTVECDELFVINFVIFVFSRFSSNLLAPNDLIIRERTKFDTEQISFKFLLEIRTLVSLANNVHFISNLFSTEGNLCVL
jgi:hypothetical protein